MILQALHDLYERFEKDENYDVAPEGWSLQRISFITVLNEDGSLFGFQDHRDASSSKARARCHVVPGGSHSNAIEACLLRDNTAYMLGYRVDDQNPHRTQQCFEAFRELHIGLRDRITHPNFEAVCRFLNTWKPSEAQNHPELAEIGTDSGIFQIRGKIAFVHELPEIKQLVDEQLSRKSFAEGMCLITGRKAALADLHEPKIKGVKSAQTSGALVVSFNKRAFESFGLEELQGLNAPVSAEAAGKYCKVLNALIAADGHRIQIGDATTVFWTETPTLFEAALSPYLTAYSERNAESDEDSESVPAQRILVLQKLYGTLRAVRSGGRPEPEFAAESEKKFCILGLTGQAGGRIGVRFWHQSSVGQLLRNLANHHADLEIVRPTKNQQGDCIGREFPTFAHLIQQTAREAKNVPPLLIAPLIRAALEGGRYPDALASAVIRRIRADRQIDPTAWGENALETYHIRESAYLRASILKAWLIRNHHQTIAMTYDPTKKSPAYRLGALFALLEKTQQDALGDVNAGIRDRFYSSASATPASVFPRLMRTYGHHLKKAAGDRKGYIAYREKEVQGILAEPERMNEFPSHLNLRDQGIFAIGYYHKRKDLWTSNKPNAEAENASEQES